MRISDWSSDVCSSDLHDLPQRLTGRLAYHRRDSCRVVRPGARTAHTAVSRRYGELCFHQFGGVSNPEGQTGMSILVVKPGMLSSFKDLGRTGYQHLGVPVGGAMDRSEEHTSEL